MDGRIAPALDGVGNARWRAVRFGLIAAGAVVALLAGILAVLPYYVEGAAAKASIQQQLAELTGGEFRYATLEFRSWPRPTADVRQISFRVAPVVEGTAERALLRFALLPLLKGELKVSKLALERPAAVVLVPAFDPAPVSDPLAAYRAAIAPALAWLAQPSVRRLQRPRPGGPPHDRPAPRPAPPPPEPPLPVVGAGGRERHS